MFNIAQLAVQLYTAGFGCANGPLRDCCLSYLCVTSANYERQKVEEHGAGYQSLFACAGVYVFYVCVCEA